MSIIDGSVKDHQPIDSASGITNSEFGTKALSVNMKNTATYLRSQITRSFTAAAKKLELAKIYMDDPDINRSERELRSIDLLRKEIMMLLSIIETDSHFFDVIQTREVILSDKERTALKEVVIAHFAGKPRTDAIQDLKTAQQALHNILVARNFQFEPILSDAELAELSRELESFLDGENDEDKQDDGPIQTNDEEPGNRHFQSQQADTPTIPIAAPPAVSTASITMSVPITGGLSGIPPQPVATPRTATPLRRTLGNIASLSDPPVQHGINSIPLIQGADIEKCPCCSQAHKLYDCESRSIQKYCAVNGLCIYCTSDQHRSIECDLASRRNTPAPSTISIRSAAGARFVLNPREAPTSHGIGHTPLERTELSWRGASRRDRASKLMNDAYCSAPDLHSKDFSQSESSENEWTEAKDIVEKREKSIRLPFKDVDAIITPFGDEPKDYHRFTNMIQNMVISNSRLNDTMKFAMLEKKLAGKARRYLIELNDPRAAFVETMNSIHRAFSQDNSAVNSILRQFQELTFNAVDYTQTTEELDRCKALILQLQEYGVNVDSEFCVRSLLSKIPRKILQEMRVFYRSGKKPNLRQVIDYFTDALEDLTFPERFNSDYASQAQNSGKKHKQPATNKSQKKESGRNPSSWHNSGAANYSFRDNRETHE
ncbi:unnamed protein product [Caenorhabditis brenneri]